MKGKGIHKLEKQVNDMENQLDAHSLDILTTARLATVLHNNQTWKEAFESKTQILLVPTTSIPQADFLAKGGLALEQLPELLVREATNRK